MFGNSFSLLTEEDKRKIYKYILTYASEDSYGKPADLEWLLRCWAEAKDCYLTRLFDNQLIVKKTVDYEMGPEELMDEIEGLDIFREVQRYYLDFLSEYYQTWTCGDRYVSSRPEAPNLCRNTYELRRLMSSWCLASNAYDDENIKIEDPLKGEGHYISIQRGCKPFRALQKINSAYRFISEDKLEQLRIAVSVIFNKRKISGDVYLSIHPLDYMTMSDNACRWSSCMSWIEPGCYRQGTVEMMNSPMVVVAYMTSTSGNFHFYDEDWNNKKWRSLFIISKDFITSIKNYPYDNRSLNFIIVDELKNMVKEKFGWTYGQTLTHNGSNFVDDDEDHELHLYSNEMYNDFGTTTHVGCLGLDVGDIVMNYSGKSECMWCGSTCYDGGENSLVCCECGNIKCCDCCGERIYNDEYYTDGDGNIICSNCRWEDYDYDMNSAELYRISDMTQVSVLPVEYKEESEDVIIRAIENCDFEKPYIYVLNTVHWNYASKQAFHKGQYQTWYGASYHYYMFEDEFKDYYVRREAVNFYEDTQGYNLWSTHMNTLIEALPSIKDEIALEKAKAI